MIAEAQLEQITEFKKEFLEEAKAANAAVEALRNKISSAHNNELGKSFLKSSKDNYLKLIPLISIEKLENTLERDFETCKVNVEESKTKIDVVTQNLDKFILQQQQALQKFVLTQQKVLYSGGKGVGNTCSLDELVRIDNINHGNTTMSAQNGNAGESLNDHSKLWTN